MLNSNTIPTRPERRGLKTCAYIFRCGGVRTRRAASLRSRAVRLCLLCAFACTPCFAQYADTFLVTVADKTPEHPYYGLGYGKGYVVNGEQSPTIALVRGRTYLFNTHEVPPDLVFEFYTVPIGGGLNIYSRHLDEHDVTAGIWIVRADQENPDTLYYASTRQPWMGGTILIVNPPVNGVEDTDDNEERSALAAAGAYPNPFAVQTELRFALDAPSEVRVDLVDALGRVVLTRQAGTMEAGAQSVRLNAAGLARGVYLWRIEALSGGRRSVATGKVQVM